MKNQQHRMSVFWSDSEHPNIPSWQLKRITLHEGLYVNSSDGQVIRSRGKESMDDVCVYLRQRGRRSLGLQRHDRCCAEQDESWRTNSCI